MLAPEWVYRPSNASPSSLPSPPLPPPLNSQFAIRNSRVPRNLAWNSRTCPDRPDRANAVPASHSNTDTAIQQHGDTAIQQYSDTAIQQHGARRTENGARRDGTGAACGFTEVAYYVGPGVCGRVCSAGNGDCVDGRDYGRDYGREYGSDYGDARHIATRTQRRT